MGDAEFLWAIEVLARNDGYVLLANTCKAAYVRKSGCQETMRNAVRVIYTMDGISKVEVLE